MAHSKEILAMAKELDALVKEKVQEESGTREVRDMEARLNYVRDVVFNNIGTGRALVADFQKTGLLINGVEAEGFLRGCLYILNELKEYDDFMGKLFTENEDEG